MDRQLPRFVKTRMQQKNKKDTDLFQRALDRAAAISVEIPTMSFGTPRADPFYVADLVRFDGTKLLRPYGRRFLYRDDSGAWQAVDALLSKGNLIGIALHGPAAAEPWARTLRDARRRKAQDVDPESAAFVMTPGFNLHFLSFSTAKKRIRCHHLRLDDGLRTKPRSKFLKSPDLKRLYQGLLGRRGDPEHGGNAFGSTEIVSPYKRG